MTIKRRNKLPKRLKERCKKLRIRITKVRNGKRIYKTKKAILKECKKKLKRNKFGMGSSRKRRITGPSSMSAVNEEGIRYFPIEMDDEIEDEDEDEVEDANNYNEYINSNYINTTEEEPEIGDNAFYDLDVDNLSQGMKAVDIIHDIKNNFQRGVGAVRNFLKGDSNGNIFNMNTFIDIFKTFDYKSEKKVIAAYLRNNSISHGDNRNYKQNIGTHSYVVVDGVIQDNKGVDTFTNSCKFCQRSYNLPRHYIRNNQVIKTFKVIQTILFLKEHYANYIVNNTLLEGGLPMASGNTNTLSKYTKNLLYAFDNNINVNNDDYTNNNFRNYFENSIHYANYSRQQTHIQYHIDAKNTLETLYTSIQNPNFTATNSILHNNLEYFYKFITSKIKDITNDKNKKRIKIFKESTNILQSGQGDPKVVDKAIVVIHKNYHVKVLNIFNILDASSGGNYSYNLLQDCFSVIGNNNNPMLQYGKSFNVYPKITRINNNNIYRIAINDAHFLYSLTRRTDVQTFNLKIYLKTIVNGFNGTLTAYEYNLPFVHNNSDYEAVSKFVTIKSTTFENFENNVIKYITHIRNDIKDNQGNSNLNQVPYQVINNKNAFFIQIYPDCHTGAYNNPNDVRPWQISNRCILKLRSTFSVIVRYIDRNNRLHYIVLSSVLPNNPIVKEYVRLFELCKPSYYVASWGALFNTYTKNEIPPTDTEKILLSLMNYKRIADVLQYYGLREQLDTEGNKNGLLITKDQSAFLQYFHIKRVLNGNQGPDRRITILLDIPNKKYHFHSSFGKRKNVINNLVKKFEELTNFPLVEYEFYKEGDLVKARQRINSLIVCIKDNQEAIDIVNRIFRLTGIKPTTKKYIREMEINNKRTKQLTEERNKENIMKDIKFLQRQKQQRREREEQELIQREFSRNFNPGIPFIKSENIYNSKNIYNSENIYKRPTRVGAYGKKKVKRRFLYNPNNPKKSFDVYIDKNPKDTIPIKYTTVKDVRNTIRKLERLYKTNKYPHTRIWKVGMILKVRLEVIVKNTGKKKEHFRHAKNYFHFLGQRTKKKGDTRKKMVFKFNKTYRKVS